MTRDERYRWEMFVRVRDFGMAHHALFPESSIGGQAFAAVARAAAEVEKQTTDKVLAAAEGRREKAAARRALRDHMKTIAHTARGVARTLPGAGLTFAMPKRRSDASLLERARAFIREGEARHDRFVQHGLAPTFVTDLHSLVDTFERAAEVRRQGRRALAGAQAALTSALTAGTDAVRSLDVVVINTFRGDPGALAAWRVARRLQGVSRAASRSRPVETPATTGETAGAESDAQQLRKAS